MVYKFKTLTWVTIVFAMSFLSAPGAQANEGSGFYTCGETRDFFADVHRQCIIYGHQVGSSEENFMEAAGSRVVCENGGVTYFAVSANGTSTELTVLPVYLDCTMEGLPATVNANGCEYTYTRQTTTGGSPKWDFTLDEVCPAGQSFDVEVFLFGSPTGSHSVAVCTIQFLPKTGLTNSTSEAGTNGGKDDVLVRINVNNTKYVKSGTCGGASGENGLLKGNITFTAQTAPGAAQDLWLSH